MSLLNVTLAAAAVFSLLRVGGGLYEVLVIDPCWPRRPDLIQPGRGGINRKRFWIPAHTGFELTLIASLVLAWNMADLRWWILAAMCAHGAMRIWSMLDFIPKALAFERADIVDEGAAQAWTRRSRFRIPLDLVTSFSLLAGVWNVCLR